MAEGERATLSRGKAAATTLARMGRFVYHLARDPRVPWSAKAAVIGLGAYLVSPYDLIPDWIPWAGALDDLLLIPIALNYVFATVPEEVLLQHWGEDLGTLRRMAGRKRRKSGGPQVAASAPTRKAA